MAFDFYITKNNKRLRLGYTTGTCAALAAKAACEMVITQKTVAEEKIVTPKGIEVEASILEAVFDVNEASCCVIKDGGDDIDATNGMKIYVNVKKIEDGIIIDGGDGIGRVTRKGLDQPIGSAAINSVPRKMIKEAILEVIIENHCKYGFYVKVYAPEGEKIAKKTFNSNLGIEGGISIIGSSGIVEPQSLQAISDTIKTELHMLAENQEKNLIITPGNYGEAFLAKIKGIEGFPQVKCSNFIGDTLDYSVEYGFEKLLLIGHAGKLVKIAGGVMNTHSAFADCRMEILAAHTALFSAKPIERIMSAVTIDEAIEILDEFGLREVVMESITQKIEYHLCKRTCGLVDTGVIMFSNAYGVLAMGENGKRILAAFGGVYNDR